MYIYTQNISKLLYISKFKLPNELINEINKFEKIFVICMWKKH